MPALSVTAILLAVSGPAQGPITAFVNVSVIPMDRERVLPEHTVLVRGDRIVALGPADQVPVPSGAVQVDGQGKFLIPGLADLHVHLDVASPTAEDVSLEDVLFHFVANGVTTVRDMRSNAALLADRRRAIAAKWIAPRIYTAGDLPFENRATPKAFGASVASLKAARHDFVALYALERPYYDSVIVAAKRVGLRVAGQVPPGVGLEAVLEARWASIEHLTQYLNYVLGLDKGHPEVATPVTSAGEADTAAWLRPSYRLDEARLRTIAVATQRAGVWNCPTLVAMEQFVGSSSRYHAFHQQITKALHDASAGLLLGTDAMSSRALFPGFSVHGELAALVAAGLTPYQALETGTRNAALFLGTADSTGTVAVGKRADLVLLYGNPLQDIGATAGPAGVMVGGRWLSRATIDAGLESQPYGFDLRRLWWRVTP